LSSKSLVTVNKNVNKKLKIFKIMLKYKRNRKSSRRKSLGRIGRRRKRFYFLCAVERGERI